MSEETVAEAEALFYLIKKGSNFRVLTIDQEPLVLDELAAVKDSIDYYEKFLRLPRGTLVGISVAEYHRKYTYPQQRMRELLWQRAKNSGRAANEQA